MNTLKSVSVTFALTLICVAAQAQFGKRLGDAVQRSAENTTIRKAEQKTDEAVSKGIDKATDPNTYKGDGKDDKNQQQQQAPANTSGGNAPATTPAPAQTPQQDPAKAAEMAYAKSDFVAGDEIIFEDLLTGEKLGEFPSMWDLVNGNVEIARLDGENVIALQNGGPLVRPFMKNLTNYLPEIYTIEFDVYLDSKKQEMQWCGSHHLQILDERGDDKINIEVFSTSDWHKEGNYDMEPKARVKNSGGDWMEGTLKINAKPDTWAHVAVSVNKRAVKAYLNGVRFSNVPNYGGGGTYFRLGTYAQSNDASTLWVKNIRVAKGAVPLYDRMMTDGKFITYGITFDVGKSTIKPESMGEINRIATLLKENPDLKFSVEGHTDSTGSAATNQTLSEARSQAVVAKLVENGIAADRLKAAGKGQTSPIADNGTDEGRAKNRRVEFVKL